MSQAPSETNNTSRASESYMQLGEDQLQYFSNGGAGPQTLQRGNTLGIRLPGDNGGLVCPHDEKRQSRFQRPPMPGQKPDASDYYNKYFNQNQQRGLSASEVTSQRSETSRSNRILAPQQGELSSRASASYARDSNVPAAAPSKDQYYANDGSQRPSSRPSARQSATPSQRSQLGGSQVPSQPRDVPSRQSESMRSSNVPQVSKDQYYSSHRSFDAPSEPSVHLYEVDDVNRLAASDVPPMEGEQASIHSASRRSAPRSQQSSAAPRAVGVDAVPEPATFASRHSSQTADSSIRSEPDKTRPRLQSDAKPVATPTNMYQEPAHASASQSQRSQPDMAASQTKSNASSRRLSDVRRAQNEASVRSAASSAQAGAPASNQSRPLSGSRQQPQEQLREASVRSAASSAQPAPASNQSRPLSGSRQQPQLQQPADASVRSGASSAKPTSNQSRPLSGFRQQQQEQPADASVRSGASSAKPTPASNQSRPLSGSRQQPQQPQRQPTDASMRSATSYNPEDPRAQYPRPAGPPRSQSGTPSRATPVAQERSASQASSVTPVRMSSEADIREVQSDSPYNKPPRRASKALWENSTEGDDAHCTFQPKINRQNDTAAGRAAGSQVVEQEDEEGNPTPAPVFSRLYADAQRYNRQRAEREKAIEMQQQMQRGEIPYDAEALRRAGLPAEEEEEFVVQQPQQRSKDSERVDGQRDTAAPGDEPPRRHSVSFEVFDRLSKPVNITLKYEQAKELKEQQRQEEEKRAQEQRRVEMQQISNYLWNLPGPSYTMADLQRQNALFVA